MRTLEDTAASFDRACRAVNVHYAVVGGFAVSTWGQPRTTTDVDVLLVPPKDELEFSAALVSVGLSVDPRDIAEAREAGGHVTIFDRETAFHIDAKMARNADEREQVEAAVEVPFHGGHLRVARAEDTIAYKVLFGSEQDLKDARSILTRRDGRLDEARLQTIARRLGVAAQLDALRR